MYLVFSLFTCLYTSKSLEVFISLMAMFFLLLSVFLFDNVNPTRVASSFSMDPEYKTKSQSLLQVTLSFLWALWAFFGCTYRFASIFTTASLFFEVLFAHLCNGDLQNVLHFFSHISLYLIWAQTYYWLRDLV